jgi:hypothetical protein
MAYSKRLTKPNTYPDLFNSSICLKTIVVLILSKLLSMVFPKILSRLKMNKPDSDLKATGHPGAYSLASWQHILCFRYDIILSLCCWKRRHYSFIHLSHSLVPNIQ